MSTIDECWSIPLLSMMLGKGGRWKPNAMKTPTFIPDTWVRANWDSFLALTNDLALEKAKFYYNYGWLRIEMSPVGSAHAADHNLIAQIVSLYAYTQFFDCARCAQLGDCPFACVPAWLIHCKKSNFWLWID
jgi:hypothetical protein